MTRGRTVLIGVGNEFRGDDGVGVVAVCGLAGALPAHVAVTVTDGDPSRLIEAWSDADLAVVVDAAAGDPSEPGRVRRVEREDLRSDAVLSSTHGLGLLDAVRLADTLGHAPRRLVLITVDVAQTGYGAALSAPVAAALPELGRAILSALGGG